MKKNLLSFLLLWLGALVGYSQTFTAPQVEITDSVKVPLEQQLAKLFSKLDLTEVKTGLLEERGFNPIDPEYFSGESIPYNKPSSRTLMIWKKEYEAAYRNALHNSNHVLGLNDALEGLNNLAINYFLPSVENVNPEPISMETMESNTNLYKQLDSTTLTLSKQNHSCGQHVKKYLELLSVLIQPYIDSYSPQSLSLMLNNENFANLLMLRVLYNGMYSSSIDTLHRPLAPLSDYDTKINSAAKDPISISMIHLHYYSLLKTAITDNLLAYSDGYFYDVKHRHNSPYILNNLIAAALLSDTIEASASFIFRPELFISNTGKTLLAVEADFDDGVGYRRVGMNKTISVQYLQGGDKEIRYILLYSDGTVAACHSGVFVKQTILSTLAYNANGADQVWNITGSKQFLGGVTSATVSIAYGCGNDRLRKPLIVVEGFDPTNDLNYEGFITDLSNTTFPNSLEFELENGGYDILYVDFHNGTDYIQRNAFLLEDIINKVNQIKEGNEPIAVMGISMGGLVARYALRDMEIHGQQHQANLFITFDTPHQGANVPLGFQYFFDDIATDPHFFFVNQIQQGVRILNSPAAKQMLINQVGGNINFYYEFMSELNAMGNGGFPSLTRNVAIANGSQSGNGQYFNPGDELLKVTGNSVTTYSKPIYKFFGFVGFLFLNTAYIIDIHVYAMPNKNKSVIYKGNMFVEILGFVIEAKAKTIGVAGALPFDSAPGGKYNIDEMFQPITSPQNFVNISYIPEFSFVNTVSALNINYPNNQDLYYNESTNSVISTGKPILKE